MRDALVATNDPAPQIPLDDLVAEFKETYRASFRRTVEDAITLGSILIRIRERVKQDRQWLAWIEQHCDVKKSTVYNLIWAADNQEAIRSRVQANFQDPGSLSLEGARRLLAPPPAPRDPTVNEFGEHEPLLPLVEDDHPAPVVDAVEPDYPLEEYVVPADVLEKTDRVTDFDWRDIVRGIAETRSQILNLRDRIDTYGISLALAQRFRREILSEIDHLNRLAGDLAQRERAHRKAGVK